MIKNAIVIGSGIGGIATALRLKKMGLDVHVYEANDYVGGKLTTYEKEHYRWDAGPSLFTMPNLVDELFQLFGANPKEHFKYIKKNSICNYFWEDGTRFTASADHEDFIRQASEVFGEPIENIRRYIKNSRRKYDLTSSLFLEKSLHKKETYLSKRALKSVLSSPSLNLFSTLHDHNRKSFRNEKLIQLFNRYATYNGSSPYKTPGIMSMIPHLEMGIGTYFPENGMIDIARSLHEFAEAQGVKFHFGSPVEEILIDQKKAVGIRVKGEEAMADVVVSNADVFTTYERLIHGQKKPEKVLKQERSSSALIFYWGVKKEFPELDLHNIFFSESYREEFESLFDKKGLHHDPTVYINITSKENAKDAPSGCENWFVMINAPGNFDQDWEALIPQARQHIMGKISRMLKVNLSSLIESEMILDPVKIEKYTGSHRGSLYGTSSNSMFSAFWRHPNFSRRIKNLFFCGGSVHPGGGIPLCLNSAKITTELIQKKMYNN